MNTAGMDSFFAPLGKEYCNYFYFLSVFFFLLGVVQVVLFGMKVVQKGSVKDLPQLLLEQVLLVLEAVEALISNFIPSEVLPPYTLCKFLTFLGFPKQISVSNLVLDGA